MEGVLLDQEHGEPVALVELADGAENLLAPASARGRATARRAAAGAAGSSARARSPASAARRRTACRRAGACAARSSGNSAQTRLRSSSKCAGSATVAPICRFSSTRHAREDAPALGRLRDAQLRDLVRRHLRDVAAVEGDRAFARARIAEDRHHQRGLAGAVGADQRDDLAFVDVEVDALQRHDVAVEGLDAADGEQRLRS